MNERTHARLAAATAAAASLTLAGALAVTASPSIAASLTPTRDPVTAAVVELAREHTRSTGTTAVVRETESLARAALDRYRASGRQPAGHGMAPAESAFMPGPGQIVQFSCSPTGPDLGPASGDGVRVELPDRDGPPVALFIVEPGNHRYMMVCFQLLDPDTLGAAADGRRIERIGADRIVETVGSASLQAAVFASHVFVVSLDVSRAPVLEGARSARQAEGVAPGLALARAADDRAWWTSFVRLLAAAIATASLGALWIALRRLGRLRRNLTDEDGQAPGWYTLAFGDPEARRSRAAARRAARDAEARLAASAAADRARLITHLERLSGREGDFDALDDAALRAALVAIEAERERERREQADQDQRERELHRQMRRIEQEFERIPAAERTAVADAWALYDLARTYPEGPDRLEALKQARKRLPRHWREPTF